jgi:hypothetical protein
MTATLYFPDWPMIPKASIETCQEGETLIVRARYWTPEWVRFIDMIRWPATLLTWGILSLIAWRWLPAFGLAGSSNEAAFSGAVATAIAFLLAWLINHGLSAIGGGYGLRPFGAARLIVRFSRETVAWQGAGRRHGMIDRKDKTLRIFPRPHRLGRDEEREAQRLRDEGPRSYAYRDAWEIWLQAGERFYELAAVSSEADSDAVVRRLQAADAEMTRPRRRERRQA